MYWKGEKELKMKMMMLEEQKAKKDNMKEGVKRKRELIVAAK
jgi:hypothetical protein